MSNEDRIELSRRKTLAGLATIGAAGAGAGLGTTALFSDEESFTDNVLGAGELDLYVAYDFGVDQDGVEGNLSEPTSGIVQGDPSESEGDEVSVGYDLADLKPGDSGSLEFCPRVVDNSAWVFVGIEGLVDYENGQTEPEEDVDDSDGDPGEGEGELSEAIQVTVSYCDADGETIREMDNPDDYTLADLGKELQAGFLLDGEHVEDDETDPYPGSESSEDQVGPCVCIDWEVPASVGNEIQTDSVEFDVAFYAEQARNNDTPENPFAVVVSQAEGEGDFDEIQPAINEAGEDGTVLVRDGTYEEQVVIGFDGLTLMGESRDGVEIVLPDSPQDIPGGNGPEVLTISPAAEAASGVEGGDESLLDESWWRSSRGHYEISGVTVFDLTVDGNGQSSNRGLYAVHAENYTYQNVRSVDNGDKGSGNGWSRNATFEDVDVENNDDDGITVFRSDEFDFAGVVATDNADDGVDIHGSDHTLVGIEASDNDGAGVEFTQGENNSLTGSESIDNEYGVLIENIGSASASPTAGDVEIEVDGNSLRDNATDLQMDADNAPALDVNADDNWWGDDSDPMADGKANADSGTLHLDTWLSSPP